MEDYFTDSESLNQFNQTEGGPLKNKKGEAT